MIPKEIQYNLHYDDVRKSVYGLAVVKTSDISLKIVGIANVMMPRIELPHKVRSLDSISNPFKF